MELCNHLPTIWKRACYWNAKRNPRRQIQKKRAQWLAFLYLIRFAYSAEVFLLTNPSFLPIHASKIIETMIAKKFEPASGYCALINAE